MINPKDPTCKVEDRGEVKHSMVYPTRKKTNYTTIEQAICGEDEKVVNETVVKQEQKAKCLTVKDLYKKVQMMSDNIVFNSIDTPQFVMFVNNALEELWTYNPEGWNWALADRHKIELENGKCKYRLPEDFYELSYASACTDSECCPIDQTFDVVEYTQFDTHQDSYAVSIQYDGYDNGAYLHVRMPCIKNCDADGCCENSCDLGECCLSIRYYCAPPEVDDLSSTLCKIPRRWGVGTVLTHMIAMNIHASKGLPYPLESQFRSAYDRLVSTDKGKVPSNPNSSKNPLKILVKRKW